MKKLFLILISLMIFAIQNDSYGFINQRYGWWKIRLKNLSLEKERFLKKDNINNSVINLLNSDIIRAKKILTIFECNGSKECLKKYEKKKYTNSEIQDNLSEILMPLLSLKYLELLVNNIGKKEVSDLAGKHLKDFFGDQIQNKSPQSDNIIKNDITKDSFTKNDWKYLSMELFFEIMISNKEKLFNQLYSETQKIVFNKVSKTNYLYEPDEIKEIILTAAVKVLINFNITSNLVGSCINNESAAYWYEKRKLTAGDPEKSIDNEQMLNAIKVRYMRNSYYIDIITSLAMRCSGLTIVESTAISKRFHSLSVKISNLFNVINYSLSIDQDIINRLHENDFNELNKIKTAVADNIKKRKSDINVTYASFTREMDKKRNRFNDSQNDLKEIIAKYEMDLFLNSISEYIIEYDKLNYTNKALLHYSKKYSELQEEVNNCKTSDSLKYAIKINSILPLLEDFDVNKVKKEHETKQYLTNIVLRAIARLETLISIYKRADLKVKYASRHDLNVIKAKLRGKREVVKIASWVMTDTNFKKIDQKAVQKLSIGIKKNIWKDKSRSQKYYNEVSQNIKINNSNVSFKVPGGWVQQNLKKSELDKGIIRSYKSLDGKSLIYLTGIDIGGMDEKEASELWIKQMKNRIVMHSWGKSNKTDYFWTLSNNDNNEIMEAYTLYCGNKIFILSGISTKEKYNFFKEKISSVFESLSIEF